MEYPSIRSLPLSLLLLLSSSLFTPAHSADEASINGIPPCANACALSYITNSNCPLTNSTCICAYLAYYTSCVASSCNGTDSAKAIAPPVPFYIPSLTISIASTATSSCAATPPANPVFGTTRTTEPARTTSAAEATSASPTEAREGGDSTVTSLTTSPTTPTIPSTSTAGSVTGVAASTTAPESEGSTIIITTTTAEASAASLTSGPTSRTEAWNSTSNMTRTSATVLLTTSTQLRTTTILPSSSSATIKPVATASEAGIVHLPLYYASGTWALAFLVGWCVLFL